MTHGQGRRVSRVHPLQGAIAKVLPLACCLVGCLDLEPSAPFAVDLDPATPTTLPDGTVIAFDSARLAKGNLGATCGSNDLDARVEATLSRMSLAQKIAEMHGRDTNGITGPFPAGGDATLGIPPLIMLDGPRGVRLGTATAFPVGMARGATFDPLLERRIGLAIGRETLAKGANVILAPAMNLLRHPGWGRAQETYGEDPLHLARMASAFIHGAQNYVIASAKHFAANSIENTRFEIDVSIDERTLREVYLPHFRYVVEEAFVGSVMTAYNKLNGQYCAENSHLVTDILKGDWRFKGFVESDWLLGTRSTVPSALAGLDIEMPLAAQYGDKLREAVLRGEVNSDVIDAAVRRILRQKYCFRLDASGTVDGSIIESEQHRKLAREAAQKGTVLLKNVGALLPLESAALGKLSVIGALSDVPNLGDHGSSQVTPSTVITPLAGIVAKLGEAHVAHIPKNIVDDADRAEIRASDVAIVVVGLTWEEEGEYLFGLAGGDRATLELPAEQEQLIRDVAAENPRTVVLLEAGSALVVRSWIDSVPALIMAWYPGMEGGHALSDLLFGDVSPSGKLPVTFPRSAEQLPAFDTESLAVTYDSFHGYWKLDRDAAEPEFPFGFGLSYTEYEYVSMHLSQSEVAADATLTVDVEVRNRGSRSGEEIVELYVQSEASSVVRPLRELRAFGRLALAPGETRKLRLQVRAQDLAYYDTARARFTVEPIEYTMRAGASSRDLPLSARFRVLAD